LLEPSAISSVSAVKLTKAEPLYFINCPLDGDVIVVSVKPLNVAVTSPGSNLELLEL